MRANVIILLLIAVPYMGMTQIKTFIKRYEQEMGTAGWSGGMFVKPHIKVTGVRITDMPSGSVLKFVELKSHIVDMSISDDYIIVLKCDDIAATQSAISVMKDDIKKDPDSVYKYYITDDDYLFMNYKDMKYNWGMVYNYKIPHVSVNIEIKYLKEFSDLLIKASDFCVMK